MPRRPAKDGGHTAFTDHRISRRPEAETNPGPVEELIAWREPDSAVRERNLALALVTAGLENRTPNQVIRGFRMLSRLEKSLSGDAAALTALGTVLLKGKQLAAAERRFARALELRPNYAPYEVNLAVVMLDTGNTPQATSHLERAVQLDPLLQQGVLLLSRVYREQYQDSQAARLLARYRTAMGIASSAP
jgi:predicted Zn-dependent protease